MKFLIAVFLPVFLFIPTSPFINFGDFCQSPRLLYPSFLLFWSKFVSLPVYSALPFYLKLESTGITMHQGSYYDCSCHKNEKKKKKKKPSPSSTMMLFTINYYYATQVHFFSLQCWFLCMTSLDMTSSMLKTSVKFLGTSFKFWLCSDIYV